MNMLKYFAGNPNIDPNDVGIPQVSLNDATIANLMSSVFILVGGIAVLFVLIGSVRYVTANGDPGRLKQARDTILYALIGVVVALAAFTIVQFTLGSLSGSIQ